MKSYLLSLLQQWRFAQISFSPPNWEKLLLEITAQKITKAVFILIFSYLISLFIERAINWFSERIPRQFRIRVKQSLPVWRAFVLFLTVGILLKMFIKLSPNNLLAVTGTGAVAIGFAFKDYASSVIAGVVALFEAPYRVGDYISIDNHHGEVVNYGLRGIQMQTLDDHLVTLPHSKLWTDAIVNTNNGELEAEVVTHFYLDHHVDLQQVIDILYQTAYTSKYSQVKLPISVVLEDKLWGSHFQLQAYVMDVREEEAFRTDLTKRAKQAFQEMEVAYPQLSPTVNIERLDA